MRMISNFKYKSPSPGIITLFLVDVIVRLNNKLWYQLHNIYIMVWAYMFQAVNLPICWQKRGKFRLTTNYHQYKAQQKWLKVGLKPSTFLLLDSWVQAESESRLKSGLTLTFVGLADSDSDSDPLDSDSDSDSGPMDSDSDSDSGQMDSDSHLMDSDSGLMDSDSDSDSGLVDSDSLPDSRVRTHSNTGCCNPFSRFSKLNPLWNWFWYQ